MNNYLIWSNEHGAWWRPGSMGYTRIIAQAGRYTLERARYICEEANRYQAKSEEPNEVMVLSPEAAAIVVDSFVELVARAHEAKAALAELQAEESAE
jgi:hypothetical protein